MQQGAGNCKRNQQQLASSSDPVQWAEFFLRWNSKNIMIISSCGKWEPLGINQCSDKPLCRTNTLKVETHFHGELPSIKCAMKPCKAISPPSRTALSCFTLRVSTLQSCLQAARTCLTSVAIVCRVGSRIIYRTLTPNLGYKALLVGPGFQIKVL